MPDNNDGITVIDVTNPELYYHELSNPLNLPFVLHMVRYFFSPWRNLLIFNSMGTPLSRKIVFMTTGNLEKAIL